VGEVELNDEIKRTLTQIAEYDETKFGTKEENVKQQFIIPILESFGHKNRLDFEHGTGREIDIFVKDLPRDCKLIVETKRYNAPLDDYVNQLKKYVFDEDILLAILTNGEEIRIYSPIRGYSFPQSCLYTIKRKELNKDVNINILERFLSRENLTSRKIKDYISIRENEIVKKYQEIENIEEKFDLQTNHLFSEIDELTAQVEVKKMEINNIQEKKEQTIRQIYESMGLPRYSNSEPDIHHPAVLSSSGEITLTQLLKNGQLKEGQKIHHRDRDGNLYEAIIMAQGGVKTLPDGKPFNSLSMAAIHFTGGNINGWKWWKFNDKDGNEYIIDDLRRKDH
jgi:hypothetical protein